MSTRPRQQRSVTLPKTRARFRPFRECSDRLVGIRHFDSCMQKDGEIEDYEKYLGSSCDSAPVQDDDAPPKIHSKTCRSCDESKIKHDNIRDDDANTPSADAHSGSQRLHGSIFFEDFPPPCSQDQPAPIVTLAKHIHSPPMKVATGQLAQGIHRLASGLEAFHIARTKNETGRDTYLSTQGARKDEDHLSACQLSPAHIVITFKDWANESKDATISTSLRQPQPSADDGTAALYRRALYSLYQPRITNPVAQPDSALREPAGLDRFTKEVFPTIKRTVTVHMYEIPREIPDDERQDLYAQRQKQLFQMLPHFDKCSTLVLAFQNLNALKHSGIADYFVDAPKRPDLKLEIRIGIWSLPPETPKARIAKDGISSVDVAEQSRKELAELDISDTVGYKDCEATVGAREMLRIHMLDILNKALGVGLVIPYGSQDRTFNTAMWKKEVWVWGRENVETD